MQILSQEYSYTTEVNRSKFMAFIVPISMHEGMQEQLKQAHPKANHVVYAMRYLNDFEQIVENSSDDGEPKGCAGVPALNVLRGEEIVNCALYIVRYFGGIKLGTGGMARAYALATKNVLAQVVLHPYVKEISYTFTTSYSEIDKTLYQLKQLGISEYEREFGINEVVWRVIGEEESIERFRE